MKNYKVICTTYSNTLESELNRWAAEGYTVQEMQTNVISAVHNGVPDKHRLAAEYIALLVRETEE